MNRQPWLYWYAKESFPAWPCPVCTTGSLRLQALEELETVESKRKGRYANPTDYSGRFHGWLKCDRAGCGEPAVVAGNAAIEPDWDDKGEQSWQTIYRPVVISPAPPMFVPPKRCPEEVQGELVRAFGLYWGDPTAAGNALRSCVEQILTRRNVPRYATSPRGKRQRLTLHSRIEKLQKADDEAGKALMAVKWIGNEGSHGALKDEDVLDALDVIEDVIDRFWGDRKRTLARLVAQVNRRRRPRSKVVPRVEKKVSSP